MISISEASGSNCTSTDSEIIVNLHTFGCPHGQALYSMQMKFKIIGYIWGIIPSTRLVYCYYCQSHDATVSECYNTGYINQWDLPVVMLCKPDHYIAGVTTYRSSYYSDHRFRFRCCRNAFQCTRNCHLQGPVNQFGKSMEYKVDGGKVIVGALSWHSNESR